MCWKTSSILIALVVIIISGYFAFAACPSADLSGDCFVDHEDFALMASQWLTTDPCIPEDMVRIPGGTFEMGDHFGDVAPHDLPVHTVTLGSFYIGKYEITSRQYCDYLISAYDACDIKVDDDLAYGFSVYAFSDESNSFPYCRTNSREDSIIYYRGVFGVSYRNGRSMSNDPMVPVTFYGAAAYCNWRSQEEGYEQCYDLSTWECDFTKTGYRLPTEAEWEYAARGGFSGRRFPWGDTITHSQANYYSPDTNNFPYDISPTRGSHPTWGGSSPVGSFAANGYGLYDVAGNALELCNDWFDAYYDDYRPTINPTGPDFPNGLSHYVLRGGGYNYYNHSSHCRVAGRFYVNPQWLLRGVGFRIVLDHYLPIGGAILPNPGDGETDVSRPANLSWMPGDGATSHDVYFGTTNPPPFIGNQVETTFSPGMANGKTYYWRIDEVSSESRTIGEIWRFGTVYIPPTR